MAVVSSDSSVKPAPGVVVESAVFAIAPKVALLAEPKAASVASGVVLLPVPGDGLHDAIGGRGVHPAELVERPAASSLGRPEADGEGARVVHGRHA